MTDKAGLTERATETVSSNSPDSPRIAILTPCYNEELTIADVIDAFRAELPEARIYLFDNNSADRTAAYAQGKGEVVLRERRQGKGFVAQSMFREIDAEVDGDGIYPAESVHTLLEPVLANDADMVVGSRVDPTSKSQFRWMDRLGEIRHVHDGLLIMWMIFSLARDYKPLTVFGALGVLLVVTGLIPGIIMILEFIRTRFITHVPLAVLAVGLVLSGLISGMAGLALHTVVRRFQELDLQVRFLER